MADQPKPEGKPIFAIVAYASGHVTKAADHKDKGEKK